MDPSARQRKFAVAAAAKKVMRLAHRLQSTMAAAALVHRVITALGHAAGITVTTKTATKATDRVAGTRSVVISQTTSQANQKPRARVMEYPNTTGVRVNTKKTTFEDINAMAMFHFHTVVEQVIAFNKKVQKDHNDERQKYEPATFLRLFCTVRLDVGRQVGKTHFIANSATGENACVVRGYREKSWMLERKNHSAELNMYTMEEFQKGKCAGKSHKTLFVDEPALVFADVSETAFFEAAAAAELETIVFLGL